MIAASAAWAQNPLTGTTGPVASSPAPVAGAEQTAPATHHRRSRTLQERFDEANTTHDGHLTAEQARAKMPAVARDFAAIDTGNKGYVTLDDIHAHTRAQRAARKAAKAAAHP